MPYREYDFSHIESSYTGMIYSRELKLDLNLYNPGLHKEVYFYCEYVDFCSLCIFKQESQF